MIINFWLFWLSGYRNYYSLYHNFGRTKLAQGMFSNYLNSKCESEGLKICSYAVAPGGKFTRMHEKMPGFKIIKPLMKVLMQVNFYG